MSGEILENRKKKYYLKFTYISPENFQPINLKLHHTINQNGVPRLSIGPSDLKWAIILSEVPTLLP